VRYEYSFSLRLSFHFLSLAGALTGSPNVPLDCILRLQCVRCLTLSGSLFGIWIVALPTSALRSPSSSSSCLVAYFRRAPACLFQFRCETARRVTRSHNGMQRWCCLHCYGAFLTLSSVVFNEKFFPQLASGVPHSSQGLFFKHALFFYGFLCRWPRSVLCLCGR
jgi:hypothetical protein